MVLEVESLVLGQRERTASHLPPVSAEVGSLDASGTQVQRCSRGTVCNLVILLTLASTSRWFISTNTL